MRVIFLQREVQRCEEKKFSASVRTSPAKVHAREKMSFTKQHEAKEIVYIYIYISSKLHLTNTNTRISPKPEAL